MLHRILPLVCCVFSAYCAFAAESRPNIILILADDLGYGDLGCYGNPVNRTPHIDQLAAEGIRFTDFHSNGPMCSPTRAALLTGLYQNRFGRVFESALSPKNSDKGLPKNIETMPQMLKRAGYATGLYGKWHLGYRPPFMPNDYGFDDFRGLLTGDGDHVSQISRSGTQDWYHNDAIAMEEGYTAELVTQHSIEFMRAHRDEPFFLFVSHLAIHFPWQAPGEDAHRVEGGDYWNLSKLGPHPEGDVAPVVKAMVESLDDSIGAIMVALRELALHENTFVFFTSDNGGYLDYGGQFAGEISSNGVYRGQKTQVWEGGHRVPAIAWWPEQLVPAESDARWMTMDLLPTFAHVAAIEPPGDLDGEPYLFHERYPSNPRRDLFWRADDEWAIRREHWKLVGLGDRPAQLFNLSQDPGETTDVAGEYPKQAREMLKAYREWADQFPE